MNTSTTVNFSVVISLYNKEGNILSTIRSVLEQNYADFELLVVNDGSTDKSREIVENIEDSRIRIIDKNNGGVSSARNKGILEASNEWIAFLDGDDVWLPHHLEQIAKLITDNPKYRAFCGSFITSKAELPKAYDESYEFIQDYFEEAIKGHFFWTSVAVIHKDVFNETGVFPENITMGEDLDMWARIGAKFEMIRSRKISAIYVQEADNKLSHKVIPLNKTIFDHIDFKNKRGTERKYFKHILIIRIKHAIKYGDFSTAFYLFKKYLLDLIK